MANALVFITYTHPTIFASQFGLPGLSQEGENTLAGVF